MRALRLARAVLEGVGMVCVSAALAAKVGVALGLAAAWSHVSSARSAT